MKQMYSPRKVSEMVVLPVRTTGGFFEAEKTGAVRQQPFRRQRIEPIGRDW